MLLKEKAEKLDTICQHFEEKVVDYIQTLYAQDGFIKQNVEVLLDFSPQYNYEQLENETKTLRNQQNILLYRLTIKPTYELLPYFCEIRENYIFWLDEHSEDNECWLNHFCGKIGKKIAKGVQQHVEEYREYCANDGKSKYPVAVGKDWWLVDYKRAAVV